jgi:hypothetical protein
MFPLVGMNTLEVLGADQAREGSNGKAEEAQFLEIGVEIARGRGEGGDTVDDGAQYGDLSGGTGEFGGIEGEPPG